MMPRDSRKALAFLVHYSQDNIILDREQFQVSDMLHIYNYTRMFFLFQTIRNLPASDKN